MRTFTVSIEHGPYGLREVTTRVVVAANFDAAVKKAKAGLQSPKAMSVSVDSEPLPETGELFGGFAK